MIEGKPGEPPPLDLEVLSSPVNAQLINAIIYAGDTPADQVIAAALGKFEPLQAEAAAFIARHKELVGEAVQANEAFTQARDGM